MKLTLHVSLCAVRLRKAGALFERNYLTFLPIPPYSPVSMSVIYMNAFLEHNT